MGPRGIHFRVSRGAKMTAIILLGAILLAIYHFAEYNEQKNIYFQKLAPNSSSPSVDSLPKCQQNMSAEGVPGFRSLPQQIQRFLYYRHCRHFPMILDVPDKCGGVDDPEDIFLLLVIKSPPINYERREVLRKTWAEERSHKEKKIRRVFISGTAGDDADKTRMNKLLKLEQQEHNDILQWDFNESFFNLTLKQVLFLEWMGRKCRHVRFLFNGDDDVLANTDKIVEYLASLDNSDGRKHLFTGDLIMKAQPQRESESKYYVPIQVYEPKLYPSYCGGGGYMLSGYTALVIYSKSDSIPLIPIDDVYMGMCLAKANLAPTSHQGVKTFNWQFQKFKYDPCKLREILLVHDFCPGNIYIMWHEMHEPKLKCGF